MPRNSHNKSVSLYSSRFSNLNNVLYFILTNLEIYSYSKEYVSLQYQAQSGNSDL